MPFGLCNAPATFQRVMDEVFAGINGIFVIPYLDDIIVYSKSKDEHAKHLQIVMDKIVGAGLVLNKKKCRFFQTEVVILGSVIGNGTVKPDPNKIKAINTFTRPKNLKNYVLFWG